jgi:hypothetical protein
MRVWSGKVTDGMENHVRHFLEMAKRDGKVGNVEFKEIAFWN